MLSRCTQLLTDNKRPVTVINDEGKCGRDSLRAPLSPSSERGQRARGGRVGTHGEGVGTHRAVSPLLRPPVKVPSPPARPGQPRGGIGSGQLKQKGGQVTQNEKNPNEAGPGPVAERSVFSQPAADDHWGARRCSASNGPAHISSPSSVSYLTCHSASIPVSSLDPAIRMALYSLVAIPLVKCGLQAVCPLAHWPQRDSVHTGKKIEGSVLEIQFGTGLSEPPPIGYRVETEKEMQTVKTKVLGVYPL
ncbi:unnamed protein product [Arctogadus glacialis]